MWTWVLLFVLLLCFIHIIFNYNHRARLVRKIPGPDDHFIIGNALALLISPVELFDLFRQLASKWKHINRIWAYPYAAINIYDPETVEMIIASSKNMEKSILYKFMNPWLQEGLLLSNGSKWHKRRKILTSGFHFNILKQFNVIFKDHSQRFVEAMEKTAGEFVDIGPIISDCTLNTICETAMGTRLSDETSEAAKTYKQAIHDLGSNIITRISRIYLYPDFVYNLSSTSRHFYKLLGIIHSFTGRVINDRKKYLENCGNLVNDNSGFSNDETFMSGRKKKTAMLDLLILAEKENLIDGIGIQEEVDTFMFEGHDTTAAGLIFCLMLLANNKYIQDKILIELDNIFGDSKRQADMEDLSKMRYLECCIKESMRLYPPVPFIGRILSDTVVIDGYTVPAGTYCHIPIYDMHRREDLFMNALEFNPDRFLPENCKERHPFAYIPFSAGPRNCIGQKFAMMEMKSLVSAVLRQFELVPKTKPSELRFTTHLILKNSGPVYVSFKQRNK